MESPIDNALNGFSPDLTIELFVADERFNVASLGPSEMALRGARPMPAGRGTLRITLDGKVMSHDVHLSNGIDPDRDLQTYQVVEGKQEAAA
jgi:hypothetical protein